MQKHAANKAWVVAVDMGYGHQRTAFPLRGLSYSGRVIKANDYLGIPARDKKIWDRSRSSYEFISRFRSIPFIGLTIFLFFDSFQRILGYYPKRDLSKPTFGQKILFYFINRGWGEDLIQKLNENPLPLLTTFFTPAFMAERVGYQEKIYCIICDADIARAWVNLEPATSTITYLVPNTWTRDRLKLYGVKPENIVLTGYPLPKENIGGRSMEMVKKDTAYRLLNLDPSKRYQNLYQPLIKKYLGQLPELPNHPLTMLFSIGGAGAQKEIAISIINSLKEKIKAKKLRFIISVGTRKNLKQFFEEQGKSLGLGEWFCVLYEETMEGYFAAFNETLRTTDILMTKPSELSFYAGLGIPIVIEPSIGSQEDFNHRWLLHIGAGVLQENPKYTAEWIDDLLEAGDLAEMAMQGFVEIEKLGTYNIETIISHS